MLPVPVFSPNRTSGVPRPFFIQYMGVDIQSDTFSNPSISFSGTWVGILRFGLLVIAATITAGLCLFPLSF